MADTPEPFEKSSGVPDSSGDIVVTDRELFDHAVADKPAPEPAAKAEAPQAPTPQQPAEGERPRDDLGRFAPKQPQAATTQQPAPQQPQPQPQQPQQRQPEDHRVPVATLLQERERAYRAEAELQQMRQAWAQYQQQLAQQQQQQPQQQVPQTIYDDPDAYLANKYINPLRQEGMQMIMRVKDEMSREMANQQFGPQVIDAALGAIAKIRQTPHGDFVYNQIMSSGHPYGALVQWAKYQHAQQQIGNDPEKWFQQRANQLLDDPKFQAAAIERARRAQSQQPQGNSRPPNVQLPPSLSSLPASSGRLEDEGDLSNDSLYRFATK